MSEMTSKLVLPNPIRLIGLRMGQVRNDLTLQLTPVGWVRNEV